jgi:hypothetical protein
LRFAMDKLPQALAQRFAVEALFLCVEKPILKPAPREKPVDETQLPSARAFDNQFDITVRHYSLQ